MFSFEFLRSFQAVCAGSLMLPFASLAADGNSPAVQTNPFSAFFGEWTLKDDSFSIVWDGKNINHLKIPNHHTKCSPINTDGSVLCVVNADVKGHIFWSFDSAQKKVHHLSHFGKVRSGVGSGTLDHAGNVKSEIRFQDEPEGTYRKYEYVWKSKNEYHMMSRQYDASHKPTGNWYGGTFIRIPAR